MDSIAFAGPDQDGANSQINMAQATVFRSSGDPPFPDPNTTDFSALTGDTSDNSAPAWSALGDFIAYQRVAPGGLSDIYVLDPTASDGSMDVNLTQGVGDNRNPDWEAVGLQMADVFPIRPVGRRGRKRHPQADAPPAPPPTPMQPPTPVATSPTQTQTPPPAFSAVLGAIAARGHGRNRVVLFRVEIDASAVVTAELRRRRRRIAFHRWHISEGTRVLRLRVSPARHEGTYQLRITIYPISGPAQKFVHTVRLSR
jgi:hypothetical protein